MSRISLAIIAAAALFSRDAVFAAEFMLGTPINLGPEINTSLTETSPAISPDGLTLYYGTGASAGNDTGGRADFWVSRRPSVDAPWGPRTPLDAPINSPASLRGVSISPDNLSLYFSDGTVTGSVNQWRALPGGRGGPDLWVMTRHSPEDDWQEPINLGPTINSRWHDASPSITADGTELYFASTRPGGSGDADIWVSRLTDNGEWGEPGNVGPVVNHGGVERSPSIAPDGLTLFFSSDRPGGYPPWIDIWVTTRDARDALWGEPVNLGPPINDNDLAQRDPRLSFDGSELYFSQWTPPGSGQFDIFKAPILSFEKVSLQPGSGPYSQTFDEALGPDGNATGTSFPTGWTTSKNGVVFHNSTTRAFPVGSSLGREPTLNAGAENDSDRALAIGVASDSDQRMLQLLGEVTSSKATALDLKFDIEAWDVGRRNADLPGEAVFDVTLEADSGDGFTQIVDFGKVTTGTNLLPSATGDYINGNLKANRVSFDSGIQAADIPAGSQLRVRWSVPGEAATTGWVYGLDNVELNLLAALLAGDANQDYEFDQLDLVQVQQAAKYLNGQPATWGQGDWNGAPGGYPGAPPQGDGEFNQLDIIAAQQGANYLAGPFAAVVRDGVAGDDQTSIGYDSNSGQLWVDAPADRELTSINIDSAASIFTGSVAQNLGGSFDNDADANIFKATFGSSFGSVSFGIVAQSGLSEEFVLGDLSVVGSLAGGGDLGNVDLVYVPEPASALLLVLGALVAAIRIRSFTYESGF